LFAFSGLCLVLITSVFDLYSVCIFQRILTWMAVWPIRADVPLRICSLTDALRPSLWPFVVCQLQQMLRQSQRGTEADSGDDMSDDDDDSDTDGLRRTASSLKVFCCSSTEFLKLSGKLSKDGSPQVPITALTEFSTDHCNLCPFSPVVSEHCRITSPCFLTKCCKRRPNQGSFVFALFAFSVF